MQNLQKFTSNDADALRMINAIKIPSINNSTLIQPNSPSTTCNIHIRHLASTNFSSLAHWLRILQQINIAYYGLGLIK